MASVLELFSMALRYHNAGDLSGAEQFSLAVLKEAPSHAEALHLLGLIAWRRGNLGQAVDYLKKSLSATGGADAPIWKHLGDVHLVARNVPAAVASYEQALRLRPDVATTHNDLGNALQHLGEWDRAALCHQQAVRLMPSFAPAYNSLGNALRGMEKWTESLEAFQQALKLEPANAEIAYKVAITLHEQGDLDQAVSYYREALRLKPGFADVSNSLATAYKDQGLFDEAIAHYRQALTARPDHALAYYNLSKFAAEGRYQFAAEELDRIKALMASPRSAASDRSLCCFALATVLAKQGCHDEAFTHYQEAKNLRKRYAEERDAAFDVRGHAVMVDRIIATYDQAYFAKVKGWGVDTDLPVFIVGMPRSGSTLVEQILASHSRVFGAGEQGEVAQYITRFVARSQAASPAAGGSALLTTPAAAQDMAADYLQRLAHFAKGAERVTIKTLPNFLHLGLIATLFPRARIIHCRRDPLDVCLSCYFTNFKDVDFALSLEHIGAYYVAYEKLMTHWARVLPVTIHEVSNEELIRDQQAITRGLLDYCGLEWDERCLNFWSTRRVVQTASSVQVRRPISAKAIGRWKLYRSHLGPLFKALGRSEPGE